MFTLKQHGLASATGVSRSLIASYETGERPVTQEFLERIRERFPAAPEPPEEGVNLVPISPAIQSKSEQILSSGLMVAIPLWRSVFASDDEEEMSFYEPDSPEYREVPAFYTPGDPSNYVLCIASGQSMTTRIDHAERFIVKFDPDVPTDHLVVAKNPNNAHFVKALRRSPVTRQLELHSVNGAYRPITNVKDWVIRGGLVWIRHNYEPGLPNIEWDDGRYLRA